jgi:hypothetical protein
MGVALGMEESIPYGVLKYLNFFKKVPCELTIFPFIFGIIVSQGKNKSTF